MTDIKGEPAIPFKRCDSNGRTVLLDSYKGNWLLIGVTVVFLGGASGLLHCVQKRGELTRSSRRSSDCGL